MSQKLKKYGFWLAIILVFVGIITAVVFGVKFWLNKHDKGPDVEESKPVVDELPDDYIKVSKVSWDNAAAFSEVKAEDIHVIQFVKEHDGNAETAWVFDGIKFFMFENVVSVVVPNDLQIVGTMHGAFAGLTNLTEIKGLEFVDTSFVQDMGKLFEGCGNLEILDFAQLETNNVVNAEYMFKGCSSLTKIDLSANDMSNVTSISYTFAECSNASEIILPALPAVRNMSYAFSAVGTANTEGLVIGGTLDVTNVKTVVGMFSDAKIYDTSVIEKMDVSHITDMTSMFEHASFESIDLNGWDVSAVENMDFMFRNCKSTYSLKVDSWRVSSLKSCQMMFYNCYNLSELELNWIGVDVLDSTFAMFMECTSLQTLKINCFNGARVGDASSMFQNCTNLKKIICSGFEANASDSAFFNCVELPHYHESNTVINEYNAELYFVKE